MQRGTPAHPHTAALLHHRAPTSPPLSFSAGQWRRLFCPHLLKGETSPSCSLWLRDREPVHTVSGTAALNSKLYHHRTSSWRICPGPGRRWGRGERDRGSVNPVDVTGGQEAWASGRVVLSNRSPQEPHHCCARTQTPSLSLLLDPNPRSMFGPQGKPGRRVWSAVPNSRQLQGTLRESLGHEGLGTVSTAVSDSPQVPREPTGGQQAAHHGSKVAATRDAAR